MRIMYADDLVDTMLSTLLTVGLGQCLIVMLCEFRSYNIIRVVGPRRSQSAAAYTDQTFP